MPIINPDLPSDGETADAADVNDVFNAILAVLNGGIDADNMAANSVGTSELQDGSVTEPKLAAATRSGWYSGMTTPNTVTYNGNRSYTLVFNTVDYTGIINPGTRLRLTRSATAPTQCTSLNGSSQYWVKTSPNKCTFTDDFVTSAWIKLSSYPGTAGTIISRYNGTSGWILYIAATGQVIMQGYNAGAANTSYVISSQSVSLNKWVHVASQLDMSAFTATTTTSYVMLDGADVPSTVVRGGTNPTALVQAGNLEVGSVNTGTLLFPGKLAQVALFSAKVTQATMQGYISQGLSGTETNLASAYSFNNSVTDLNTTTPNDLSVGGGSAVATNADSPFGVQASGLVSSTLVYGIVQSAAFSTNTTVIVQVPEGNTIPTSGGITDVAYSGIKAPYGMPLQADKWVITYLCKIALPSAGTTTNTWYNPGSAQLGVPVGAWKLKYGATARCTASSTSYLVARSTLSTTNNSESDNDVTHWSTATTTASTDLFTFNTRDKEYTISSYTVYYLNIFSSNGSISTLTHDGTQPGNIQIKAENAYV